MNQIYFNQNKEVELYTTKLVEQEQHYRSVMYGNRAAEITYAVARSQYGSNAKFRKYTSRNNRVG